MPMITEPLELALSTLDLLDERLRAAYFESGNPGPFAKWAAGFRAAIEASRPFAFGPHDGDIFLNIPFANQAHGQLWHNDVREILLALVFKRWEEYRHERLSPGWQRRKRMHRLACWKHIETNSGTRPGDPVATIVESSIDVRSTAARLTLSIIPQIELCHKYDRGLNAARRIAKHHAVNDGDERELRNKLRGQLKDLRRGKGRSTSRKPTPFRWALLTGWFVFGFHQMTDAAIFEWLSTRQAPLDTDLSGLKDALAGSSRVKTARHELGLDH
jgi:hypothetical protein